MTDRDAIVDVVVGIVRGIAPEVEVDRLDRAVDLREQIDFDSMDFLTFVDAVHAATGIEIPERDYPHVATIDGCVRYLTQRAAAGGLGASPTGRGLA
jgi:acyl carrier protein